MIDPKKFKMGSDCKYCYLDEGIYNMIYFCTYGSGGKKQKIDRVPCRDGFTGECPNYKQIKIVGEKSK